jgi:hypothetical protein
MRTFLAGLALAFLLVAVLTAGASAQIGPGSLSGVAHSWAVQYMNGAETVSVDQAVAAAKEFDVIAALPKVYRSFVGQMKAANPKVLLFAYMKGVFTYDTNMPEAAYSHDVGGNRIHGLKWPGTWLLDPTSSVTVTKQIDNAQQVLAQSGYDGVFLDTLGPAALNPTFVSSLPVNPTTGQVWTVGGWVKATARLAGKIAASLGAPVMGNGLRDGPNYFKPDAPTSVLLKTGMGGAMAEAWLRGATSPIDAYPKEVKWKQNVDAIVDAGANGGSFFAVTKIWTNGTQAQKDAWYKFTVASFLLGNDGKAYLTVSYKEGDATVARPLDNLDLGTHINSYDKVDGVYQRTFTGGRVLVNPTDNTYTVPLGGIYFTLDGMAVTSVTMRPQSAEILKTQPTLEHAGGD